MSSVTRNKQAIAYVYYREPQAAAEVAKVLTLDEARRIASNIAKLPDLAAQESRFLRRDIPPVDAFSETPGANEPCP